MVVGFDRNSLREFFAVSCQPSVTLPISLFTHSSLCMIAG